MVMEVTEEVQELEFEGLPLRGEGRVKRMEL